MKTSIDSVVLIGVALLCVSFTYAVIDTLNAPRPVHTCTEIKDQRPDIPQCNKELWLRIKDGCANMEE